MTKVISGGQVTHDEKICYIKNNSETKAKLKDIVNTSKKYIQSFGIYMKNKKTKEEGGHRILLLKYSKANSSKEWYAISAYAPSYSTGDSCVYIHKKYNKVKVKAWSKNYNIYGVRSNKDFGKYAKVKIY